MVPKLCFFLGLISCSAAAYKVPDVVLEAFNPKGFRAYIPDEKGLELFAFHGKINSPLGNVEPGEFSKDVKSPSGAYWVYEDPNVVLEVGDIVHYWVFIQNSRLGYRKDNKWQVKELVKKEPLECTLSMTVVGGKGSNICRDSLIFEDNFETLDESKWITERYIPSRGPDFEFNSYDISLSNVNTKNNALRIKPIPKQSEADIRGVLDLRYKCTRTAFPEECYYEQFGALLLPPVTSGKIRSKFSFLYGKVEVRAKLPAGDWIFPEIALIPVNDIGSVNATKLWIAYARGNENLVGGGGDIGARRLYAGEVSSPYEPQRSSRLMSVYKDEALTKSEHVYTLVWKPGTITAFLDNVKIGEKVLSAGIGESVISLGVGVGGNNDFPDGYKSGTNSKPWRNRDIKQIKTFFAARNEWLPTWQDPQTELKIDYVKIYAL